jgi:hypothetical protein
MATVNMSDVSAAIGLVKSLQTEIAALKKSAAPKSGFLSSELLYKSAMSTMLIGHATGAAGIPPPDQFIQALEIVIGVGVGIVYSFQRLKLKLAAEGPFSLIKEIARNISLPAEGNSPVSPEVKLTPMSDWPG